MIVRTPAVLSLMLLMPAVAAASPISAYAIFAGNQVGFGTSNTIAGMSGANAIGVTALYTQSGTPGSVLGPVQAGGNVSFGANTTVNGTVIAGGWVSLDNNAVVNGNVDANAASGLSLSLNNAGSKVNGTFTHNAGTTIGLGGGATIAGNITTNTIGVPTPYVQTVIPAATASLLAANTAAGASFNSGASQTLAPGTYNDIFINNGNSLTLGAGTYYFDTWSFGNSVTLNVSLGGGNLFLYFTGNVALNNGFNVAGVTGANASQIYAETLGNWTLSNGSSNTGKQSWVGTIFGSGASSDIFFGSESTLAGQAWARDTFFSDQHFTQINPPLTTNDVVLPEPATLVLVGTGLVTAVRARRRRAR